MPCLPQHKGLTCLKIFCYASSGPLRPHQSEPSHALGFLFLEPPVSTTVEITLGDDGKISVGLTDAPSSVPEDMQPASSLADALQMARHILSNPQAAQQEEASEPPDGDDDTSLSGSAAATAGSGGTPNGKGGGTGPDQSGPAVADDTQGPGAATGNNGQDAKAIWDALANMNLPQH